MVKLALLLIAAGVTILILGTAGGIKIYKGSKITFAYTMVTFTCAYGLDFLIRGVTGFYNEEEWDKYV